MQPWIVRKVLSLSHGINKESKEVLLSNDYPNSSLVYLIQWLLIAFVHISLLVSKVLLQVVGGLFTTRLDANPE